MNDRRYWRWLGPALAAVILFGLNAWLQKLFAQTELHELLNVLVNCFTVPGIVLVGVGLLGWIATFGQFDILSYSTRQLFGHFIRPLSEDLPDTFAEYRQNKDEKGRGWNRWILYVGLICLGFAGILLIVYYLV